MALSDRRILDAITDGSVVIEPFNDKHLSTSSYDVTLGQWHFRERKPKPGFHLYDIFDKEHTDHVWGTEAEQAPLARDILGTLKLRGIKPDQQVILLTPGETILAHTNEYIGGRGHITTMMKARSSLGRNFIEVCKCAGWGDVGYINRWTMEITNNSQHYTIPLVVGMRIAQIIFFETGPIRNSKSDYTKKGKYADSNNLAELKQSWKPNQMLPRIYKDIRT